MADFSRRSAIGAASIGAAGLALAASEGEAAAQATPALVPAFAGSHWPKPLKFDPAKLRLAGEAAHLTLAEQLPRLGEGSEHS
jgi:hypothetical protein